MIVLWIILWIVGGILGLIGLAILIFLLTPIYITTTHQYDQTHQFRVTATYLRGLFGIGLLFEKEEAYFIRIFRERSQYQQIDTEDKEKLNLPAPKEQIRKVGAIKLPEVTPEDVIEGTKTGVDITKKYYDEVWRTLGRLTKVFSTDTISWEARYKLTNPATTGIAYGIYQALHPFLPSKTDVRLTPEFIRHTNYTGRIQFSIKLRPIRFVFAVIASAFDFWKEWRRGGFLFPPKQKKESHHKSTQPTQNQKEVKNES